MSPSPAAAREKRPARAAWGAWAWRAANAARALYQAAAVDLGLPTKHLGASKDGRHIPLATEHPRPLVDARRGHAYVSNNVCTSRYTVWDFFPKQLLFQFSRTGNFYFLCVGIPQTVRVPVCISHHPRS